jgi:hypothetical protein
MAWGNDQHAAGASKARNKLASYLAAHGIPIRPSISNPPQNQDFLAAIQAYAEWYARKNPKIVYKTKTLSADGKPASVVERLRWLLDR